MTKRKNKSEEERLKENENNKLTAEIAQIMKNAGLQMPAEYFFERTGIKAELVEVEPPMENKEIASKIKNFYKTKVK